MLTIKKVFHLTNRAVEGFVRSLFGLLGVTLSPPDHTTVSRRGKKLNLVLPRQAKGHMDIVLDSTGLKIYGQGEWKMRMHGKSKRRTWRKLHLAVDPQSGEIAAAMLTENSVDDAAMVAPLFEQIEQMMARVAADGSYEKRKVYRCLDRYAPQATVLIPPRKDAHIWQHGNYKANPLRRDENLRTIRKIGRRAWKEQSGYHMRSLVENAIFRFKTIFGDRLSARLLTPQKTEALICCAALNRMTHLGVPDTHKMPCTTAAA